MTTKAIALLEQRRQGLLPPGRRGQHRQARPRRRRVRSDRRDRRPRRGGPGGAGVREEGRQHVCVRHRRPRPHQPDRRGRLHHPRATVTLLTADDQPMTINYATAAVTGSQQHTGTQLRIAGYGPRAANIVGLTDQTDLFFTIADALRLPQTDEELSRNGRIQLAPAPSPPVPVSSSTARRSTATRRSPSPSAAGDPPCLSRLRLWPKGRSPSTPPPRPAAAPGPSGPSVTSPAEPSTNS